MTDSEQEVMQHDSIGETRLWQAVILTTIREWMSGPLSRKVEAERYLFGDGTDFADVCKSAGMNAGRLRGQLARLKRQAVPAQRLMA
jgi:hypothetical protein